MITTITTITTVSYYAWNYGGICYSSYLIYSKMNKVRKVVGYIKSFFNNK